MIRTVRLISAFVAMGLSSAALANKQVSVSGLGMKIEPILGYETVYRDTPSPHTATRAIYGGRASAGVDLLALEIEYTRGADTENFATAPEKIYTSDEKGKVGLRSTYRFNEYFFTTGRIGCQGTRGYTETTSSNVLTRTDNPIKYNPYAGASVGINLGSFVSISAGSTMVFRDTSDLSKNDVQNVFSISVGIN
jgi:hypothetical protein